MPTCRDITEEGWADVREALVEYFSRRQTYSPPEDLAQETLITLWRREDYPFAKVEDIQRVAYGFAAKIILLDRRRGRRNAAEELYSSFPSKKHETYGLTDAEIDIFLQQVIQAGEDNLSPQQWRLVQEAAVSSLGDEPYHFKPEAANMLRVQLHRARKRLASLTGWKKAGRKKQV